jgi:hypothetical protein
MQLAEDNSALKTGTMSYILNDIYINQYFRTKEERKLLDYQTHMFKFAPLLA